jgi:hypothetical protein
VKQKAAYRIAKTPPVVRLKILLFCMVIVL